MKILLILALASLPLISWSQRTVEFEVNHSVSTTDTQVLQMGVDYEVFETGDSENPINWDATASIVQATRDTGRAVLIESTPTYNVLDPVKGDAVFGTVGVQGRKFIVKDLIEGMIRADYGFRLHDNDKSYGNYYGEGFHDYSGVNLSTGVSFIASKKYAIGGMVTRNMETGTTTVRLSVGFKLTARKK